MLRAVQNVMEYVPKCLITVCQHDANFVLKDEISFEMHNRFGSTCAIFERHFTGTNEDNIDSATADLCQILSIKSWVCARLDRALSELLAARKSRTRHPTSFHQL